MKQKLNDFEMDLVSGGGNMEMPQDKFIQKYSEQQVQALTGMDFKQIEEKCSDNWRFQTAPFGGIVAN